MEPHDTYIDDALARLRESTSVPPVDQERERALLAAFDAHWRGPRRRQREWGWIAASVPAATALAIGWIVLAGAYRPAPAHEPAPVVEPVSMAGFVPWPGAHALPPFEGGEMRQVVLPVSALRDLGLAVPPTAITVVKADVIVGYDGFARAVRIAQ